MSDDTDHADHSDHEHHPHEHHEGEQEGRVTAPMQEFTMSQVITGFIVMLVGVGVTMAVPLLLV
jgi:hypothetical protein